MNLERIVPIRKCFLVCCEWVRSDFNRIAVPIRNARSGAGGKKVRQILAIRNASGDGTEGVSPVFNILSPAIRKWRVEGGKAELPFEAALPLLRMNRAAARFTRAAWTMYPPCRAEISARLMIAQ